MFFQCFFYIYGYLSLFLNFVFIFQFFMILFLRWVCFMFETKRWASLHPRIHNIPACRVDVTSVCDLRPLHGHSTPAWTGGGQQQETVLLRSLLGQMLS